MQRRNYRTKWWWMGGDGGRVGEEGLGRAIRVDKVFHEVGLEPVGEE
jgi:hypothetical protein